MDDAIPKTVGPGMFRFAPARDSHDRPWRNVEQAEPLAAMTTNESAPIRTAVRALDWISRSSDRFFGPNVSRTASLFAKPLDVPQHFLEMLFVIEDKRFGLHIGVDLISATRAVANNALRRGYLQGASTITQQLYDIRASRFDSEYARDRTLQRKATQACWAIGRELESSKIVILQEYLTNVYWGQNHFGLDSACRGYFDHDRHQLSVAKSFFLIERLATPNVHQVSRRDALLARPAIRELMLRDKYSYTELERIYANTLLKAVAR